MAIKINNNTIIDDSRNIGSAGVVTATSFVGDLTGNATGLSGTPNINVGIITATTANVGSGITISSAGVILGTGKTFYGDGSGLTNVSGGSAGIGSTGNVNTIGIVTSLIIDAFLPEDQKVITVNSTISNNQSNISFAEDLVIGAGVTFTVSTGTTVRMDALNSALNDINSNSVTTTTLTATSDIDIPSGTVAQRYSTPTAGSFRFSSDYNFLEVYNGTEWIQFVGTPALIGRGVFGGGYTPTMSNVIEYINIDSVGNTSDFGDLTTTYYGQGACSSYSRGVFGGGANPSFPAGLNNIEYITIASVGNANDFGDLTVSRNSLAACSSSTRGIWGGGSPLTNTIDYVTIASASNATDFGDLTQTRNVLGACSSSTRGVFGGGYAPGNTTTIDYVTIASVGNATSFGSLTVARRSLAACSSSTRGLFGGGYNPAATNTIDYITIATTGNATDFGDLTSTRARLAACSSSTRGVFAGGQPSTVNIIDYVTIASAGNATDFGDLIQPKAALAACSNSHGGLA